MQTRSLKARIYGANIAELRERHGLSQERFAEAVVNAALDDGEELSLDRAAVSRWESGLFTPAMRYRPYIATVLATDARVIFPAVPDGVVA